MKVKLTAFAVILAGIVQVWCETIRGVSTTSGYLLGSRADGVASFKGIRFAQPPVDQLRWQPPVPFNSSETQVVTSLGPACVQQFPSALIADLFNTPPPSEAEDCLFLNVWAPAPISHHKKLPVVVWFYGGGFTLGTASMPMYDGESFARKQGVVVVSFNYRTNVFGFPVAPDLPPTGNNLGFLDQELALAWVQENIASFGGDKDKVTVMGHSAGAISISLAISRRNSSVVPPFRSAIMLSGVKVSSSPVPNFANFEAFAQAMGCSQSPGPERLGCLRKVPASTIRNYTNANPLSSFVPQTDNVTFIEDSLQAIRTRNIPHVPILLGNMQDDGTIFAPTFPNLTTFLEVEFGKFPFFSPPNATTLQNLYPGLNDTRLFPAAVGDVLFRCPTKLWGDALVTSGYGNTHRYIYGVTFPNLDFFPDLHLGAWHGSELRIVFGTFNRSTATTDEVVFSHSFQTAFGNFIKDPKRAFAHDWPRYDANASVPAELAYHGNVAPKVFVQPVDPSVKDEPCREWDQFLDFRP